MTQRQFFQERDLLRQAIAFPAARLKERLGVTATDDLYRRILRTVIDTIKEHGNRAKIQQVSAYFLHAVQTHMDHHGEEYYESREGREVRSRHAAGRDAERSYSKGGSDNRNSRRSA